MLVSCPSADVHACMRTCMPARVPACIKYVGTISPRQTCSTGSISPWPSHRIRPMIAAASSQVIKVGGFGFGFGFELGITAMTEASSSQVVLPSA